MKKMLLGYLSSFVLIGCFSLACPNIGLAVTLPWSTTFNCPDWVEGQSLNCNGMSQYGSWTCSGSGTTNTVINAAGNNPTGAGGSGARVAVGDGVNNQGSTFQISFASPQQEIWVRFYVRYPSGFSWNPFNYHKLVYFNPTSTGSRPVFDFDYTDGFGVYTYGGDSLWHKCSTGCGWQSMVGGSMGDGKFHAVEIHAKMDTNGSNGIAEGWIDGVQKFSFSNVGYGGGSWTFIEIFSNQSAPANGGCVYVDLDDIAISNTGYIPLLTGTALPSPPSNVH